MDIAWIVAGGPLHLLGVDRHLLGAVLAAAGLVSTAIVALALVAFARRRSWSYFFVSLALATPLVRTLAGALSLNALVDPTAHHVVEHGLDVLSVLLLVAAIYAVRTRDPVAGGRRE